MLFRTPNFQNTSLWLLLNPLELIGAWWRSLVQRIVEYLHFCWYLTPTSFLKINQLVKTFQMTYNISSFGVINILVYGDWGSNFNTCPNMVNEVKKNAKRIFFILELLNYKNLSKYRFRQLVHKELQYWIFSPALLN